MRVAVYGIAKNEARFVEAWARSAEEADVRILVDTGSSDDTVALARAAGVRVTTRVFHPWRFDTARNYSLSLVPDDVELCISLDLDEVLVPGWRDALERSFDPAVTRYRYLYTWSWNDDGGPGLQYGGDKIHVRNGYSWRYPVHEVLVNDIDEVQAWTDLEIHHHRDQEKDRDQYLPLLELAVAEDSENDRNAHYLGREYMYHERFEEGARELKRHLSLPTAKWDAERSQSMRYLAKCEPDNAESWLRLAAETAPTRREPWVDLAFLFMNQSRWQECLDACVAGLALDRRPLEYMTEAHAWGARLDDMAANAAFRLHDYPLAVVHGERALQLEPADARLRANLAFYSDWARRWSTAQVIRDSGTRWRTLPTTAIHHVAAPDDLPSGWRLMNPSIATDGERLRMIVRTVNYTLTGHGYVMPDGSGAICSRSGIVEVSADGTCSDWQWLDDSPALSLQPDYPVHGVEDVRLFAHQGRWWALGGVRDFAPTGAIRQTLAEITGNRMESPWRLPSPLTPDDDNAVYEKNWVAVPHRKGDLEVIWSTEPFVRLRIDPLTKGLVPSVGRPTRIAPHEVRGGTPVFETPHGQVYVAHRIGPNLDDPDRPGRTYLHAFITLCLEHVHIGPWWAVEELGLEFVAGACLMNEQVYLSYGRDDSSARIAICRWADVSDLLPLACEVLRVDVADSATVTQ